MAKVSTYLNFTNQTEAAFNYYKSVFGTEFEGNSFNRFGDMPPQPGMPPVGEATKNLVLHVSLPILGGYMLMGSDAPPEMGFTVTMGNNIYISLDTDTKEEADRLFAALSAGGQVEMPMSNMFWGAYWGSCKDRFGVKWMFNYVKK
jgi:PhnB protein